MSQIKQKPNCLICGKPSETRGLCKSHYETFRKSKERSKDPAAYEKIAIERNLVSAEDKRKASNPFEDLRLEIDSEVRPESIAAEATESYGKTKKKPKPEA